MNQQGLPFLLRFKVFTQINSSLAGFLRSRLAGSHRTQLNDLFGEGKVRVDGRLGVAEQSLRPEQIVEVTLDQHREEDADLNWRLLWEDAELMAVYKPHLLPVSRTTRNLYHTLISLVRRETPYADARLLHRLDSETAGIILLAKDQPADKRWKPNLDQLIAKKVYHAWVTGEPEWEQKTVECELSERLESPIRSQMYVVDPNERALYPKPKPSRSIFTVIKREQGRSQLRCEIFTGRKHQIRAHLAHLGYPIIGDKIYSHQGRYYLRRLDTPLTDEDLQRLGSAYHQLEATELELSLQEGALQLTSAPVTWELSEE